MAVYNPIAKNGIPHFKTGGSEYTYFWKGQIQRCIEGYKPVGGEFMPGNYYFYLNFCKILANDGSGRKKLMHPLYRDQDHEYYLAANKAKKDGHGLIVLKARDKGFSYMNANMCLHEWTFFQNNEIGVGASSPAYVGSFRSKILNSWNDLPPEFKIRKDLKDNEKTMMSGYKTKEKGVWSEKGVRSVIHFRCMDNPNTFRGERLSLMVFEEAGEFRELLKSYMASQACFMDGAIQYGLPIIGGTSNTLNKGNVDFMEMFYNAERYNLQSIFIPATKVYHGFFDAKTGESDTEGALGDIEARKEKLKDGKDKSAYYLYIQEYPITPEDAFLSSNSSVLDIEKINDQRARILQDSKVQNMVSTGDLRWSGGSVVWIPNTDGKINILYHPEDGMRYLDVGGVDSYTQDEALTSPSEGSCMIYRRYAGMDMPGDLPICEYTDRPYLKEDFYDVCLKIAVYYNCELLVEYTDDGFFKYFEKNNALKYLKRRPKAADSPWSKVSNRYGVVMKSYQKNLITEMLDDYVKKNCDEIYFLDLLEDLSNYGFKNTDRAIAFGLCLLHAEDNSNISVKHESEIDNNNFLIPYFRRKGGKIISINE
tara:strand:+ start:3792 stop:5573 length:1782 start_codon:yes stop_codon:yes gene_type:complete